MSNEFEVALRAQVAIPETTGPGSYPGTPYFEGERHGLPVRIVQVHEHVCGYVKVPDGHPWLEAENEWDIDTNVHGGITYQSDNWLGFDTAHGSDVWPDLLTRPVPDWKGPNLKYWNAALFMEELELLAREAAEAIEPKAIEGVVSSEEL